MSEAHSSLLQPASGLGLFGALVIALLILTNANIIGERLGIMDHPDTVRKRHAQPTPLEIGRAHV